MNTATRRRASLGSLLLAAALGGAGAHAQAPAGWDASQLPETRGTVKQYTLTPRGDVDGFILSDGTEVKLAPHLTAQVVYAIKPGDSVSVRGLKARALPLIDAATVKNDATGVIVLDNGRPAAFDLVGTETTLTGQVAMTLHGKRGEVNGALLQNGTVLRLPPPEAARWMNLLQAGQTISVRGLSTTNPLGTVFEVRAIGASPDTLTEIAFGKTPKPPPGPRGRGPDMFPPPPPPRG